MDNANYLTPGSYDMPGPPGPLLAPLGDNSNRDRRPTTVTALEMGVRALGSRLHAALWTTDLALRITGWLGPILGKVALLPDQVLGLPLDTVFGRDQAGQHLIAAHTRALRGASATMVLELADSVYEAHVVPVRDAAGTLIGLAGLAQDITEQARLAGELRRVREDRERQVAAQTAQLRNLYEQAQQNAVLQERQRLARDLHDAVTQMLFSASLIAEVLPRIWEQDADKGRQHLEDLRVLTRGALAEMRTLLLELRPAALTDARLGELLQQIAEALMGKLGLPVALTVRDACGRRGAPPPPDVRIALYRVAQEALNNVAKHADAHQVTIQLDLHPRQVSLSIRDDGKGFDAQHVPTDHLGLQIMQERVAAIGGRLQVASVPGCGTVIRVDWKG